MLKVALTGGIATGKSHILDQFRKRGVPCLDADAIAHGVELAGTEATQAIAARFGPGVLDADGAVDRRKLAARTSRFGPTGPSRRPIVRWGRCGASSSPIRDEPNLGRPDREVGVVARPPPLLCPAPARCALRRTCSSRGSAGTARAAPCC